MHTRSYFGVLFCSAQRLRCASAILRRVTGLRTRFLMPAPSARSCELAEDEALVASPDSTAFARWRRAISASSSSTIVEIDIGRDSPGFILQGLHLADSILNEIRRLRDKRKPQLRTVVFGAVHCRTDCRFFFGSPDKGIATALAEMKDDGLAPSKITRLSDTKTLDLSYLLITGESAPDARPQL